MLSSVSFNGSYTAKIKPPKNHKKPTKKEKAKEKNFSEFQDACKNLSEIIHGSVVYGEFEAHPKNAHYQKGYMTINVPDEFDDIAETYLINKGIKFKKTY